MPAIEQKFTVVGRALTYCVRLITPVALFFALFSSFLEAGGVRWLPAWLYSADNSFGNDVVWKSLLVAFALTIVALLSCFSAMILAVNEPRRTLRALVWCLAINLTSLALELYLGFRPPQ